MHISNLDVEIHNRCLHIVLSSDITNIFTNNEKYIIASNTLFINSIVNTTYSILINAMQTSNDSDNCAKTVTLYYSNNSINSSSTPQTLMKSIFDNTFTRIYETLVPVKYTFNKSIDILLDNNYSSPILFVHLFLEN